MSPVYLVVARNRPLPPRVEDGGVARTDLLEACSNPATSGPIGREKRRTITFRPRQLRSNRGRPLPLPLGCPIQRRCSERQSGPRPHVTTS